MFVWFAVLVACLLALLAIPIDVVFDLERRESCRGEMRIGWLFGLVRFPIRRRRGKPKPARREPKDRTSRSRLLRRFLNVIRQPAFQRRILRLARDLLQSLKVRRTQLHLWVGFDDPADTGVLCAWIVPGLAILRQHTEADLLLYPDFEDERLEALAHGEIRTVPLAMIAILVCFLVSPAVLRAGWTLVTPSRA